MTPTLDQIVEWISDMLDGAIPVVQSHQNAPAPEGDYVSIAYVSSVESVYPYIDKRPDPDDPNNVIYSANTSIELSVDVSVYSANGHEILEDLKTRGSLPPAVGRPILATAGPIFGPAFFDDTGFSPRYMSEFMFRTQHTNEYTERRVRRIISDGDVGDNHLTFDETLKTPTPAPSRGALLIGHLDAVLVGASGDRLHSVEVD
jgi:hypothetical protein